ncbi:diphosphomevalonate decarboxylase isoform X2 [Diabrotica virgifera virgifera]|uniref:Diphosphomevalonate decarboxylase n=1 Tax=Diabrotica virgifera virgifera TaxID=50390 RepID=A0ABM5KT79_DIAVI|nr:diphosphomevalonate decarboxylase isoform X2 [Diabrotica virgifera virgifera]
MKIDIQYKMKIVTVEAPVNIAVIKYWGKRDEELILPINDSLSATLSTDFMCAKTTILASPLLKEDVFWLNGKQQSLDNPRLQNCLKEIKRRTNLESPILNWNISICSINNFPTAAGLASSAAGYAGLVAALAALYNIEGDITGVARVGSGSACRSLYGGWVQWNKGITSTGEDSIAHQIAPLSHWPEMKVLILVVNDERKKYSSTSGMKKSVETSELLPFRANTVVPKRIEAIKEAILKKDFETFAEITMKDSNSFHAICLDTLPPCVYMNDVSHAIVDVVHQYNAIKNSHKVAYTFDAGPNACLFLLESEVDEFLSVINYVFQPPTDLKTLEYIRGIKTEPKIIKDELKLSFEPKQQKPGFLKFIIHTTVGNGPRIIEDPENHLLTNEGLPKDL